jgi:hypothetical protein
MSSFAGYICYVGEWAEDRGDVCVVRDEEAAQELKRLGIIDNYAGPIPVYDGTPATIKLVVLEAHRRGRDAHMAADGFPNGAWYVERSEEWQLRDLFLNYTFQVERDSYFAVTGVDEARVMEAMRSFLQGRKDIGEEVYNEDEMDPASGRPSRGDGDALPGENRSTGE